MQNSHDIRNLLKDEDGDHVKNSTKVLSRTTIANLCKIKTNSSLKIDHSKDKELINTGLHKLVSQLGSHKLAQKSSKLHSIKKNNESKLATSDGSHTITERQADSHIVLTKQISIDKYTMTDFEISEKPVDLDATVLNEQQPYRDLQWTDPRLLKKYQMVKQPYKKSLTIPYVNKSEYGSEVVAESDDEAELLYSQNKHFFFKFLYYFCTASVSFIGSMCGITLITVVLWKILDENVLNLSLDTRHDTAFRRMITGFWGSILNVIDSIFGKIMRLLTISTSEVFANEEGVQGVWYQKLY